MKTQARSILKIIEEQVSKWEMTKKEREKEKGRKPVIALSRQPGSGGLVLAKKLAEQIGLDLFDHELIEQVAQSSHMSTSIVETLDEKRRYTLEDWITATVQERHLLPDEYLRHLMKVVGTIGQHGGAVIVGRGAWLILPREQCLCVRVIAPFEDRVANIAKRLGVSLEEAKKQVVNAESNQHAFIRKYFHADLSDTLHFDLVVNTLKLSIDDAAEAVKAVLGQRGK